MSEEFEHDFDTAEQAGETPATNAEVGEPVDDIRGEEETGEDDFFAESEVEDVPQVDPEKVVTLVPSSADAKYVEVDGPLPMVELIARSRLQFAGEFTCYLNGAEISLTTVVPGGSTVNIIGKVKGG